MGHKANSLAPKKKKFIDKEDRQQTQQLRGLFGRLRLQRQQFVLPNF